MSNLTGYAVVRNNLVARELEIFALSLTQPCFTQLTELKVLTAACKLGLEKVCNIFTDSGYALESVRYMALYVQAIKRIHQC